VTLQAACVDVPEKLVASADVVILPERVTWAQIREAQRRCPAAIIVGAVLEGPVLPGHPNRRPYCRAVVLHSGRNQVDYLKLGSDGHSDGVGYAPRRLPVYRYHKLALGIVICMDLETDIAGHVIGDLRLSQASKKVFCVPAAMTASSGWNFENFPSRFDDVHFAVCNRSDLGDPDQTRMRSCVRDPATKQFTSQVHTEALLFKI